MSNAISAVASLLWPLIVLAALVVFRNPLARLIRQRDFTVKIAGQELSVSDLNQQQIALITDLQKQVATLEKQLGRLSGGADRSKTPAPRPAELPAAEGRPVVEPLPLPAPARPVERTGDEPDGPPLDLAAGPAPWDRLPEAAAAALSGPERTDPDEPGPDGQVAAKTALTTKPPAPAASQGAGQGSLAPSFGGRPKPSGVLWVADRPEANALEMARLQANNVHVDVATSTAQGLELLSSHRYELIVSDMARVEHGQAVPDAGQQFVRQVRALDRETPIVIYADGRALDKYGAAALIAGANTVTSNSYELAREFATLGMV